MAPFTLKSKWHQECRPWAGVSFVISFLVLLLKSCLLWICHFLIKVLGAFILLIGWVFGEHDNWLILWTASVRSASSSQYSSSVFALICSTSSWSSAGTLSHTWTVFCFMYHSTASLSGFVALGSKYLVSVFFAELFFPLFSHCHCQTELLQSNFCP